VQSVRQPEPAGVLSAGVPGHPDPGRGCHHLEPRRQRDLHELGTGEALALAGPPPSGERDRRSSVSVHGLHLHDPDRPELSVHRRRQHDLLDPVLLCLPGLHAELSVPVPRRAGAADQGQDPAQVPGAGRSAGTDPVRVPVHGRHPAVRHLLHRLERPRLCLLDGDHRYRRHAPERQAAGPPGARREREER